MAANESAGSLRIPKLSPTQQQGMMDYWEVYEKNAEAIDKEVMNFAKTIPGFTPILAAMSADLVEKENRASRERSRKAVLENNWNDYLKNLHEQGATYAKGGLSFHAWVELISGSRTVMRKYLQQAYAKQPEKLMSSLEGMNLLMDIGITGIGEAYLAAKQETISHQQQAIRELSTPVLMLRDRFLILPIVGLIDTQRARQITEELLLTIRQQRAKAVVMDITGVPMVDSKVANHLVQTVEAARLMGATVIVTGISAEIAQTMVTLGAELPNVRTFADLQGGVEAAEAMLGLSVCRLGEQAEAPGTPPEAGSASGEE